MQVIKFRGQAGEIADPVAVAVVEGTDAQLIENGILVPQRIRGRTVFRLMLGGHRWNSQALFDAQNMRRLETGIEPHVVAVGPHILRAGQEISDSIAPAPGHAD